MTGRARLVCCIVVGVVGALALGVGVGNARDGATAVAKLKTTIHGVNFLVQPVADTTFCMQAETGTLPGRTITLQSCAVADNQRWAFSTNQGTTNLILDSQGFCLDGVFHPGDEGLARPVNPCRFASEWKFVYLSSGLIEDVGNGKCLSVPGVAANTPVSLADCDATKPGQHWLVTH
jgi:hypothetical protein